MPEAVPAYFKVSRDVIIRGKISEAGGNCNIPIKKNTEVTNRRIGGFLAESTIREWQRYVSDLNSR